jgi:hypothetical protein
LPGTLGSFSARTGFTTAPVSWPLTPEADPASQTPAVRSRIVRTTGRLLVSEVFMMSPFVARMDRALGAKG